MKDAAIQANALSFIEKNDFGKMRLRFSFIKNYNLQVIKVNFISEKI